MGGRLGSLGQQTPERLPRPSGLFPPIRPPGPVVVPVFPGVPPLLPVPTSERLPVEPPPVRPPIRGPAPSREEADRRIECWRVATEFANKCRQLEWLREDMERIEQLMEEGVPGAALAGFYEEAEEQLVEYLQGLADQLDECECEWEQETCTVVCEELSFEPGWTLQRIQPAILQPQRPQPEFPEPVVPWWREARSRPFVTDF